MGLMCQPRRGTKQAASDLEQRLERVNNIAEHLLFRERIHGRDAQRLGLLVARLLETRVDVALDGLQRVPRGGQELRERFAGAERVLACKERDADAGYLGAGPVSRVQRGKWRKTHDLAAFFEHFCHAHSSRDVFPDFSQAREKVQHVLEHRHDTSIMSQGFLSNTS